VKPALSVVIRSFNSARTLPTLLDRLHMQPGDEIILVDSGSVDSTLEIARQRNVRILPATGPFNYSKSLNLGFAAAKNPWVLAISSHCLPLFDDLLESLRQAAGGFPPNVAVAYGKLSMVALQEKPRQNVLVVDQTTPHQKRWSVYAGNGLALYRRDEWMKRPFDVTLPTAEDLAWFSQALAAGSAAGLVPAAAALYRNKGSLQYMFRKGWLESRMEIKLANKQPMSLFGLFINYGSLMKKWVTAQIPVSVLLRQLAHATGAYWSPKFYRPEKTL
jgi:glycosyltransferase involved in cell wall biosynthesis